MVAQAEGIAATLVGSQGRHVPPAEVGLAEGPSIAPCQEASIGRPPARSPEKLLHRAEASTKGGQQVRPRLDPASLQAILGPGIPLSTGKGVVIDAESPDVHPQRHDLILTIGLPNVAQNGLASPHLEHAHRTWAWGQDIGRVPDHTATTADQHPQHEDDGPIYTVLVASEQPSLGPFRLLAPIGQGGMGEVWRGLHEVQGVYVAIKVITGGRARDPRYLGAFRNEVRAMAGLDHPGIVRLYDFGEVPAVPPPELGLPGGSPYLVMELVEGGSLSRHQQGLPWESIARVLRSILDALAHAHARGMVHRDLKPSNVLLGLGGVDAGLKISDFGLAHAMEVERNDDTAPRLIQGTPAYMAPEQFLASWRDYGPWTDLYALGCLGWTLATGHPPFGRRGELREFRRAHARQAPPTFHPRFPVPAGYEPWLRRLLAKRPQSRFRRAADARLALDTLDTEAPLASSDESPTPSPPEESPSDDFSQTHTVNETGTQEWVTVEGMDPSQRSPVQAPRPPDDWRRPGHAPMPRVIDGVGLGLFELRELPVLGREAEQDALWQHLRDVHVSGQPKVVILHGPAGCGRSHLARWFAQRADEEGAAIVLRADHGPDNDGGSGLSGMLERHLGTQGLRRPDVLVRVEEALHGLRVRDEAEHHALTELVRPAASRDLLAGAPRVRFRNQRERHMLIERLLARLCRERPLLLWLEDVQWGPESLAFAISLLASPQQRPLLIVATVQEDALAEVPQTAELLWQFSTRTQAHLIEVGPLLAPFRRGLIQEQLCLEGELAERVEERTAGNPMFIIQLVGDWIHRGVLEPGAAGFRLGKGRPPELPDDLLMVWSDRVQELLEDRPPGHGRALELAAVLGMDVQDSEWSKACGFAGLEPSHDLVETLCRLRLATRHPSGDSWSFIHAMLRETLLQQAHDHDRLVMFHRASAEMLRAGAARPAPQRLGRHLLAAGDRLGALGPLLEGIQDHLQSGDNRLAGRLLRLWDKALEEVELPADDTRWGAGWLEHARHARLSKDLPLAQEQADRVEVAARQHGWQRMLAKTLREQARLARLRGTPERAWDLVVEAGKQASRTSDVRLQADCWWELGHLYVDRGGLTEATDAFHEANVHYQDLRDNAGRGDCETGLAVIGRQRLQIREARHRLDRASGHYERSGARWGVAETFIHRGDVDRLAGDLDLARAHYQEARQRYLALGVEDHALLDQREALLWLELGHPELARPLLATCLETFQSQLRTVLEACTHVFLLPCAVLEQDWAAWALNLDRAQTLLATTGHVDVDLARMARVAGHSLRRLKRVDDARSAYALSLSQWKSLALDKEAKELEASLRALT